MDRLSKKQRLLKSLSWRTLCSMVTFSLSLWITQKVYYGTVIMSLELVAKIVLYYGHDILWDNIPWGLNIHKKALPIRRIGKSLSWRVAASLTTFSITLLITHSLAWGLTIVSYEAAIKMVLFYLHEMLWERIAHSQIEEHDAKAS